VTVLVAVVEMVSGNAVQRMMTELLR